ncbi:hypothetical protein BOX15_Mlig023851g1 [Macrostomum lignano]|uniref:Uncharacterized protein n=1 Tax=Macrostomum lignano TaxID=282301 RepID=A0A267DCM7_9PLAT|nr:hypothetical protein BOX15_Mlig023851g3 [Macrostomum lignano]PAA50851.1 hypothetical protein BOX15_Mlig023851g2 [Macrostomum lignano]PAA59154.1 hypothetical protein BOX15_Mlig023851g1 [Macrostomum lignano]
MCCHRLRSLRRFAAELLPAGPSLLHGQSARHLESWSLLTRSNCYTCFLHEFFD